MFLQGKLQLLLEMIFLSIDYLLLSFTHSLAGLVRVVRIRLGLMYFRSKSIHQAQGYLVSKGSEESLVWIRLDSQVALHL